MKSSPDRVVVPAAEPSGTAVLGPVTPEGPAVADIKAMRIRSAQPRKGERMSQMLDEVQRQWQAEDVRSESEEGYRLIFESIDEGCCVVEVLFDADGRAADYRFLEVNPAFERQCGLHDAVGKRMRELAPDHEAHWFEIYGRVASTGKPVRFVGESAALGGRWFDVNAFRLGGPGSRKVAVLFSDITARRQVEQALRDSEQRLLQMIDALPAAIYTTDVQGRVTHFNPAAVELAGRAPELGTDRWCVSWKLERPDGTPLPHDQCPMALSLKSGRPMHGEQAVLQRPDGTRRWFKAYPTPLHDAQGQLTGGINMLVDVTDSQRAEAALREADRHKDEFIAMLAHELRNPLAPMRNVLEVMRRATTGGTPAGAGAALASAVDMMERQVGQMVRLVDDLLDVSRISRGKIELRRQRVELSAVVDPLVQAARPMCDAAGHRLDVTVPSEPVLLDADPTRLAQIIGNLLNNACKFTERGGCIGLSVEVVRVAPDAAPALAVRVCDTGIGIAADQLSRIFGMFTQVDSSVQRSTSGLGIGLALVKNLAELHGGSVSVHSAGLGCGSEFTVRLPIVVDRGEAPRAPPSADPGRTAALRVLVVDDNRDSADSLALLLELNGHVAQTAYGGLEAVDAVGTFQPQVVLLDIGLPGVDGYEAARRIRERHPDAPLLLVALTGWGQPEDRRRTAQAGFDAHIVKPVEPGSLLSLLARHGPKND